MDAGKLQGVACTVCGKLFKDSWALKRHSPVHTGEKPYRCDYCNRGFTQQVDRRRHMRLVCKQGPKADSTNNQTQVQVKQENKNCSNEGPDEN
jgi:uncharacterized C2H2 Zn-finger protein